MRIGNTTLQRVIKLFKKLHRLPIVIETNGVLHSIRLAYECFILPIIMKVLPLYLTLYEKIKESTQAYYVERDLNRLLAIKHELLSVGEKGYKIRIEDLGLDSEVIQDLNNKQQKPHAIVIGEIDQDGFVFSHFGSIRDVPTISKKEFLVREKTSLQLVAINGYTAIRKEYHGNKLSFIREIKALHKLALAGCNVPAIMDIDFDQLTLTISYIMGFVLREELAKRGAVLRDCDVDNNPDFLHLDPKNRWLKRIQEGKRFLDDVIDTKFIENLFIQICKVHESGIILNDIKYGNIIIEKMSGAPFLIDFDDARDYSELGKNSLRVLCDRDIELFNLHFNIEKLTYKRIKEAIKSKSISAIDGLYAPVYFGAGLRIGPVWDVDSGYGRWHYILKDHFQSLSGKRILDLGANNGSNSLQLLRHGAHEVIGIELDEEYIAQGHFVKAACEWAANTVYNFRYIQADMKQILTMDLGKFDIVMALCSIYYLDDESISYLIKYINTITNVFILQCNIDSNLIRQDTYTYKKASVEYAVNALTCNGFSTTRVISPPGYNRPLVIGNKGEIGK